MEEETDIRLPEPQHLEPLNEGMRSYIKSTGWDVDSFTPQQKHFLQLMEMSGMSFERPMGEQLDLLIAWVERCVEAIRKGAE